MRNYALWAAICIASITITDAASSVPAREVCPNNGCTVSQKSAATNVDLSTDRNAQSISMDHGRIYRRMAPGSGKRPRSPQSTRGSTPGDAGVSAPATPVSHSVPPASAPGGPGPSIQPRPASDNTYWQYRPPTGEYRSAFLNGFNILRHAIDAAFQPARNPPSDYHDPEAELMAATFTVEEFDTDHQELIDAYKQSAWDILNEIRTPQPAKYDTHMGRGRPKNNYRTYRVTDTTKKIIFQVHYSSDGTTLIFGLGSELPHPSRPDLRSGWLTEAQRFLKKPGMPGNFRQLKYVIVPGPVQRTNQLKDMFKHCCGDDSGVRHYTTSNLKGKMKGSYFNIFSAFNSMLLPDQSSPYSIFDIFCYLLGFDAHAAVTEMLKTFGHLIGQPIVTELVYIPARRKGTTRHEHQERPSVLVLGLERRRDDRFFDEQLAQIPKTAPKIGDVRAPSIPGTRVPVPESRRMSQGPEADWMTMIPQAPEIERSRSPYKGNARSRPQSPSPDLHPVMKMASERGIPLEEAYKEWYQSEMGH